MFPDYIIVYFKLKTIISFHDKYFFEIKSIYVSLIHKHQRGANPYTKYLYINKNKKKVPKYLDGIMTY